MKFLYFIERDTMMEQEYSSKDTSINVVNKVYKVYKFRENSRVLDYGGGKYNTNIEYMKKKNVDIVVYDKYNRDKANNSKALRNNYYDYIVCSNVLNVIKEDEIIEEIILHMIELGKRDTIYLYAIYEGDKSGIGKATSKGYQRNQKTIYYMNMLMYYFSSVEKKNDIIICRK